MKILIVCDQFPPAFGPRMGYLCKYLHQWGHEVDVASEVLDDQRFGYLSEFPDHRVDIDYYKGSSGRKRKMKRVFTLLKDISFHYKDRFLVRKVLSQKEIRNYDLVICSTYRTFPLRAGLHLAQHFKVPFIADLRDIIEQYPDTSYIAQSIPAGPLSPIIERLFTRWLLKERNRVLKQASAVTTVSPWHQQFLSRFNPNTHLIYNGYDPEIFYPEAGKQDQFRICFTGRMISLENRNPDWLFEAVAQLDLEGQISDRDFRLCWYVDNQTREYLEKASKKRGIEKYMDIHGFVPASEIPGVLNQSCLLLQLAAPADGNGPKGVMTTKIFEALAVGKPLLLVQSDRSFLAQIINRYQCGLAAESPEQVKDFILKTYELWKRQGSIGTSVHPQVEELFSREKQARQFLSLFESVIG